MYNCTKGQGPKAKHKTLEDAQKEAERLAGLNRGDTFEILQCLGVTRVTKAQTFWMDGVAPPHICAYNRALNDTCFVCGKNV